MTDQPTGDPEFFQRTGGKYDELCKFIQRETEGAVMLVVIDGRKGNGISMTAALAQVPAMAAVLRAIADQMEADINAAIRKHGT